MLKFAAILGLVTAAGGVGIIKSLELKERVTLLEDFRRVMLMINSQMNYFREPLLTVLQRSAGIGASSALTSEEMGEGSAGEFFLRRLQETVSLRRANVRSAWGEVVEAVYKGRRMTAKDLEVMCSIGDFIGQTDFANQEAQFEYVQDRLCAQIEEAKQEYGVKGRLYSRLGFFAGAVAALIMI